MYTEEKNLLQTSVSNQKEKTTILDTIHLFPIRLLTSYQQPCISNKKHKYGSWQCETSFVNLHFLFYMNPYEITQRTIPYWERPIKQSYDGTS